MTNIGQVPAGQKETLETKCSPVLPLRKYFDDYFVVFILFFNHLMGKSSGLQDADRA